MAEKKNSKLERAHAARAETTARIGQLQQARHAALLGEQNDAAITKLDGELAGLRATERVQTDRIAALERSADSDAADARARENDALIKRIEVELAKRDEIAANLEAALREAVKLYRNLIRATQEAAAGCTFDFHRQSIALLSDVQIKKAVERELHALGAGGAAGRASFPGGKWHFDLAGGGTLSELLKQGSAHAIGFLRAKPMAEPARSVAPEEAA